MSSEQNYPLEFSAVFNGERQPSVLAKVLCCSHKLLCLEFFKSVTTGNLPGYVNLDTHAAVGTQAEGVESKVLREIFGPKRDEVTDWKRMHNEELRDLYSSPKFGLSYQRLGLERYVARMERGRCSVVLHSWQLPNQ